ncbi:hypothetical protein IWQ62_003137 [Dispira parvispora]|uniref:Zn(2)-C6 fungal-type domain-containing protein n=1 Tax=Dispira parvispora TaxID=1520584 RepID=A0A9W8ANI3_9FUNG|nr:hypothetical protein IWQ62_003137 [Dispira parvispora]
MSNADEADSCRLLRSCDRCRRLKKRCDGGKPHCTRCSKASAPCEYRQRAKWYTRREGAEPYGTEGLPRRNITKTQVTANIERITTLQRHLSHLEETYHSLLQNMGDLSVSSSCSSTPGSSPLTVPATPVSTGDTFTTYRNGKNAELGVSASEGTISAHWGTTQSGEELTGGGLARTSDDTRTLTSHLLNDPLLTRPPSFGDAQDQLSIKSLSHALHDRDTIVYLCLEHFLYFNPLVYQSHYYVLEWLQASLNYSPSELADSRDTSGSSGYDDFSVIITPPSDRPPEVRTGTTTVDNSARGDPPQAMSDASYGPALGSTADSPVATHGSPLFTPVLCRILANSSSQLKPTCLIYTLLALSCQMSDHPLARRRDPNGVSLLGKTYYDHAVATLPETLEAGGPDVVITHILLGILKWSLGYSALAFMYISLALRVAQDIKLHQLDRPVDTGRVLSDSEKFELERQRRIWWSLERYGVAPGNWCLPLYLSRMGSLKQIEFPGSDYAFMHHIIPVAKPFLSPELLRDYQGAALFSCVPTDRTMLQCDYELRTLIQDVNHAVSNCLSAKSSTLTVGTPLAQGWHKFIEAWAEFDALQNRLTTWFSNLPSHFDVNEERANYASKFFPSVFVLLVCLEVHYYTTLASLNSAYLFTLLEATLIWPLGEGATATSSTVARDPPQVSAAQFSLPENSFRPCDVKLSNSPSTTSADAKSFASDIQSLLKHREWITQRCLDAVDGTTSAMNKVRSVDYRHFYLGIGISLYHCSLVYMRTIIQRLLGDRLRYYLPLRSQYFAPNSPSPYGENATLILPFSRRAPSWDGISISSYTLPPNVDGLGEMVDPIHIALAKGASSAQHDSNVNRYLETLRYYIEILHTTKLYWVMDSVLLEILSLFLRKFTEWTQFHPTPSSTPIQPLYTLPSPSNSEFTTVDSQISVPLQTIPFHPSHSAYPQGNLPSTAKRTFPMTSVVNSEVSSSTLHSPIVISSGTTSDLPSPTTSATGPYSQTRSAGLPADSQPFDKDELIQKFELALITTGHRYDPFYLFFQACSHQDLTTIYELFQKFPVAI